METAEGRKRQIHQIQKRKSMLWHKPTWYIDGETLSSGGMNTTIPNLVLKKGKKKCHSFELTCETQVVKQQPTSVGKTVPWWPIGRCLPPAGPSSVRPGPPRPYWDTCGRWFILNVWTVNGYRNCLYNKMARSDSHAEYGGVFSTRFLKSLGSIRVGWDGKFDDAEADDWKRSHLQ